MISELDLPVLTLKPKYQLIADGEEINGQVQGRIISLTLTDNRGFEADMLEIVLDDADRKLKLPKRGVKLGLHLGWSNAPLIYKGQYVVDEVSHSGPPDVLTLRARSADFRATLNTRREQSYHNNTVADIMLTIAKRNQLKAKVEQQIGAINIEHIDQTNESDGAFVSRLAKQIGAIVTVKDGLLLIMPKGKAQTVSGKALPAMTITRKMGDGHSFSLADRAAYTGVIASWLNTRKPKKQTRVNLKRKQKQGDYLVGEDGNVLVLARTYANKENAERAAKAAWEKLQRDTATLSIQLAIGRAELYPEMPVTVKGFKPEIDAAHWILARVTHSLNDSGFTSSLELEVKITDKEIDNG